MAPTKTKSSSAPETGGVAGWKRRAGPHKATLASGQQIEFRLMGVGELALRGAIPTHLRELVALHLLNEDRGGINAVLADDMIRSAGDPEAQARLEQHLGEAFEISKQLVAAALVTVDGQPADLTPADLDEIPFGDLEELVRLITGRQPFDSMGVRIGVEPLDYVARFHELHGLAGSPADCEACAEHRRELSSVHLGRV